MTPKSPLACDALAHACFAAHSPSCASPRDVRAHTSLLGPGRVHAHQCVYGVGVCGCAQGLVRA